LNIVTEKRDWAKWKPEVIKNKWNPEDKQMNGKQRNFYLDYIKKNYPYYWCLVLDADEVCEDINKVKEFIQKAEPGLYSPIMEHFVGDLGHLDNTRKIHFVPNRLFKISEADKYPLDSHPVLTGNNENGTDCTTIWHLGHLPIDYIHYIMKRYNEHKNDSTIHSQNFLRDWKNSHLFGAYPTRTFNPTSIPKVILNNFGIDFDELYFLDRSQMEAKHYQDVIDWKNYFKCETAISFGCGFGQRVKIMNDLGVLSIGLELSDYAVKNSYNKEAIKKADITDEIYKIDKKQDLVVAYDVLEHLDYKDLDKAINNLIKCCKNHILISVPFKNTPNADNDPTHIIKEDRNWWTKQFTSKGLKLIETPSHFQFKEQILIFEKVKK